MRVQRQALRIAQGSNATETITEQILPSDASRFQIVCKVCDGLGIVFDCTEGAPSLIVIKCRHCGAPSGTLGDLRNISTSDKHDVFEF